MSLNGQLLFEINTKYNFYQVWDTIYGGRQAIVLYSGHGQAAQSGLAKDNNPDLLFDYNQRITELVNGVGPARVLLIGGGMYTLPTALVAAHPQLLIDVIEIDEALDAIAAQFFHFQTGPQLKVFHEDGFKYLQNNQTKYDLVLLDAFNHTSIPDNFTGRSAAELIKRALKATGLVAVNVISSYFGAHAEALNDLVVAYEAVFPKVDVFPASRGISLWLPQNFVVVGQLKPQNIESYLRFAPVSAVS